MTKQEIVEQYGKMAGFTKSQHGYRMIEAAVEEAFEEAAKVCERNAEYLLREVGGKGPSDVEKKQAATSRGLAAAIRQYAK